MHELSPFRLMRISIKYPRLTLQMLAQGIGAALIAAASLPVLAQTSTITATTDLVVVPALVRNTAGESVPDLQASDFLLTDNGVPQRIALDDSVNQPLSIVVLMQVGASAPREFPNYAKLNTMLTYLTAGKPHEVAMVTFDSRPEEQWDFTTDIADLEDGFAHPDAGDAKAAILDGIDYGINLLRSRPQNRRRFILLLSQTHDDGSVVRDEDIVKRLGESNITIECLTFSPEKAWLKDQFTKERQGNKPYQYGANGPTLLYTFNLDQPLRVVVGALRQNTSASIAVMSGGESLPFSNKSDLEQRLATLANHLSAAYTLTFQPISKQTGFHHLKLRVLGHPDLQVSARSSYWTHDLSTYPNEANKAHH